MTYAAGWRRLNGRIKCTRGGSGESKEDVENIRNYKKKQKEVNIIMADKTVLDEL